MFPLGNLKFQSNISNSNLIYQQLSENKPIAIKADNVKQNPYVKSHNLKCFQCFQFGHKSNECLNRRQLQLAEGELESKNAENSENMINDIEETKANKGEILTCVLERILIAPRQPSPSQRHAIFRTRCTIAGKVCEVLIDSGCRT